MKQRVFLVDVERGSLPLSIWTEINRLVRESGVRRVSITLAEARKKRSLSQNAFFWGVVVPIVKEMFSEAGQSVDEMEVHEYLKRYVGHLTKTVCPVEGESAQVITMSSTKLTTVEWENYIEQIRAWAAQFGVAIPFPNESFQPAA